MVAAQIPATRQATAVQVLGDEKYLLVEDNAKHCTRTSMYSMPAASAGKESSHIFGIQQSNHQRARAATVVCVSGRGQQ